MSKNGKSVRSYVDDETYRLLHRAAAAKGVSLGTLLRMLCIAEAERQEIKDAPIVGNRPA